VDNIYFEKIHRLYTTNKSINILIPKTVSPHGFRHSKAKYLLQSGPLIDIRHFGGHEFISTTQVNVKPDMEMKRRALEKAFVPVHASEMPIWQQNHDLTE
jgi:integrase/recombinase XerD